ncbi:MAG: coiled coil domain-containing protein [Gammaproteobacteria bacterium]|nr:coiled coil domain-containing protein [Gammaproteobacteria bacterium]MBU1603655.1 coiled coil domain-containing protein [Gammaproteobacteria bacterium]MBU2435428.1 coiled coil domain-containing protein [Gammaproteobacteria bacterium]MBU2449175.1 coiled coil domain-containing protein [Gammaproteobacteria bacterium]
MNRDEFTRKMHSRLDQWNNEIDALVARKDSIEETARAELNARLEDLRAQRDRARSQLATLQNASETAWQDMKAGLEMAWDAVAQAIESAKSRYK